MKQRPIQPYGLRMPHELKHRVEASAQLNDRSMNAEIVYQLKRVYFPERFKQEEVAA